MVRKDALTLTSSPLHYVRPTLFYSTFLFIYYFLEQLHNRPIASLSPHQTSNTPPSNSTSTSSSASPPSAALTICTPRLRPAVLHVFGLAYRRAPLRPPHRVLLCPAPERRPARAHLSPPQDTHCARFLVCFCELQVWSRVAMVEVGNLIYW